MGKIKSLKNKIEPWEALLAQLEDVETLLGLALEMEDDSQESEVLQGLESIQNAYEKLRILELLSEETDTADAYLTIHSGAGGTEANDWASMLYRMYSRWAERKGFKSETIDFLEAEGGVKSVTIQLSGDFAHGFLKGESGVHRLVRISPFDSSARRHTSFASVYVSPVIDDDVEVDIKPDELRVDTYRAQGAGGQHVNKTESAVRITHLPTNIVVQCQNERSQHKNRDRAMKVLKSRLYEHYKAEKDAELAKNNPEKMEISWGSQIRSYVFQPYTMVKDHRTKHESGNIQSVMDGDIDGFIEEYLKYLWSNRH
jgi:peptide chain release factor 2